MKIHKVLWLIGVLSFLIPFSVYAAINITNRTGDIRITMPDGTQVAVGPDEPLPLIPDGATINILSGSADISATGSSYVAVVVGTYSAMVEGGDAINVSFDPVTGAVNIEWQAGTVTVTAPDGTTIILNADNPSFSAEVPVVEEVETKIETEESAGDISPSR